MLQNYLIIFVILAACVGLIIFYIRALKKDTPDIEYESVYSIDYLTKAVAKEFSDYQNVNLKEQNYTRKELEAAKRKKLELRRSLKTAGFGDENAKKFVISFIKNIISSEKYGITESTADKVLPFNHPMTLDTRTKNEIIFLLYKKHVGRDGLAQFFLDYHLNVPKKLTALEEEAGAMAYEITAEDIDRVFPDVLNKFRFTDEDKLTIICQRIFMNYVGLSVTVPLFEFAFDEIDGGVSGVPMGTYDLRPEMMTKDFEYSYNSIFITFKGINYKMSNMSFGSQEELVRVCQNIYKYSAPYALSKNKGFVVGTMKDGSRIAVARPDACGGWCFFARKFDSTPSMAPEALITDENNLIPITFIKWIVKTMRSFGITGEMGAGKSTELKSVVRYIPSHKNIRVFEISPELNLQFTYPKRNIVNFSTTESISMQELYDFGKKTNSSVNIVGESASAEMGVIAIQSATVGSEQAIFTHHAKTASDLILSLRDNLTTAGGYSSEKVAEEVVAKCINFNIHMGRTKGHRYIERITEIVPIYDRRYPTDKTGGTFATEADTLEYYKRITDRRAFETRDIVRFNKETQAYEWVSDVSPEMMLMMCNALDAAEEQQFLKDLNIIKNMKSAV